MARKENYLSNKNLLEQHRLSMQQNRMTDTFVNQMMLLTQRLATKSNFAYYSYREDMESAALLNVVRHWDKFDASKSDNPFSYFTQCISMSFIQYIKKEKNHCNVRDALLVEVGLNPSHNYDPVDNQVESVRALDF